MKTIKPLLAISILSFVFFSCSKKSDPGPSSSVPTLTTTEATNINGLSLTLNGAINSTGGSEITNYGFCWSSNPNPTTSDFTSSQFGHDVGYYSMNVTVADHATYHARAFAENANGVAYGNDITFSSEYGIISQAPTDIVTTSALFRGNTPNSVSTPESRGYCYNTLPDPNISNSFVETSGGFGNFTIPVANLLPNTVYYAKSFYTVGSEIHYGEELNFKTTGYFGPAGGYVAYDKGELTDGWRYLEVYTVDLDYSGAGSGAEWGCDGNLLSNTNVEMGTGLANTQRIISTCIQANCAARLCDNFSHGGFSDWFLGSREEMLTISKSLKKINISLQQAWTSSETVQDQAYEVFYSSSSDDFASSLQYKSTSDYVYAIRRY